MSESIVERIQGAVENLPPLPQVVSRVMREMENPDVDVDGVRAVLSKDPAIAGKILAVANSAYYSRGMPIASLRAAILVLGLSTIRNVVVTIGAMGLFAGASVRDRRRTARLWEHSLATAYLAGLLADRVADPAREERFIEGLLHDAGRIALLRKFPEQEARIAAALAGSGSLGAIRDREREVLGFTHADLGAAFLAKWRFPDAVRRVVGGHHDAAPDADLAPAPAVLRVADALAHRMTGEPPDAAVLDGASDALGVTPETLDEAVATAQAALAADKALFGLSGT
jgi:putative nucleotidyltransferase with HDIG domain